MSFLGVIRFEGIPSTLADHKKKGFNITFFLGVQESVPTCAPFVIIVCIPVINDSFF